MRPVRLVMEGFGAFRARTVVDFADTDFFALVGATGSGKSTVIDAVCFALYGSVPRYADRRLVGATMSTGAAEARVELTFAVGDETFRAVRVVRRQKNTVSTREAVLERVVGGEPQSPPRARGAAELDDAVVRLLGLPFEHFTRCVVLPQGQFARFLHDSPADRQKLLTELLQTGVYGRLMQRANLRVQEAAEELVRLGERIAGKGDLSAAALAAAEARRDGLDAVIVRLLALDERIGECTDEAAALVERQGRLRHDQALLAGIAVPAGVGEVERGRERADAAVVAAEAAVAAARGGLVAAQEGLRALPSRDRLERVVADHGELRAAVAALADDRDGLEQARSQADAAGAVVEALDGRRVGLAAAAEGRERLGAWVRAAAEQERLTASISALMIEHADRAREEAWWSARCLELAAVLAERRAVAGPVEVLDRLVARHGEHGPLGAALSDALERREAAARRREAAEAGVAGAGERHRRAQEALEERRREQAAAVLAASLRLGDPCPVCRHPVGALPVHGGHADVEEAAAAEAAGRAEVEAARSELVDAVAELAAGRSAAEEAQRRLAACEEELQELAGRVGDAGLARSVGAAEVARQRAREAGGALAGVEAELAAAEQARTEASTARALAAERERSARERLASVDAALAGAPGRADLDAALATAEAAAADLAACEEELRVAREARTAAVARVAAGEARVEAAGRRCDAAQERWVAHAMTAEEAAAGLVGVAAAEAAVAGAEAARAQAEAGQAAALDDRDRAAQRYRELEEALVEARERVAALGLPPRAGGLLSGQWAELAGWAAQRSAGCGRELEQVAAEEAARRAEVVAMAAQRHREAAAGLGEEAVAGLDDAALRPALERARAEASLRVAHIGIARQEVAALEAERKAWEERQGVARELGRLLSAKHFPQWLQSTALAALVAAASEVLERLTRGQFALACTEAGDFEVVDHHNADERRSVKSLSGGETFQASLALALALSQEISGAGVAGAARLESIFLDEGFGTLDPDTLDTVADTIETLGSDGRMVGIVTHVRELADRVPVRFRVTKGPRSSMVVREASG